MPNKDEARLRAAAPSFSSFNPQAGAFEASRPALAPSYPSFGRQSQVSPVPLTYPSLTGGGPSQSPSFSPAPLSHNLAGGYSHAAPHQQQQQQYPSLGLTSQSPTGFPASYGVGQQQQHHPSYSPLPFAPSPQQQQHQHLGASPSPQPLYQQQYRSPVGPPQGITNPALIANYGYGAVGGAFGAVGAGNRGVVGGPGGYGRSPAPSPYGGVSQGGYRDASSSFAGSPQDARSPLPFMGGGGPGGYGVGGGAGGMGASSSGYGGPSPVMMPQHLPPHHSPFLQHQQAPYGGGAGAAQYSPQMQGGRVGGAGGVGGPVQQGYRRGQW